MTASVEQAYPSNSALLSISLLRPLSAMPETPSMSGLPDHGRSGILGIGLQRWVWTRRASSWDHGGAAGLERVVRAVLEAADVRPGTVAIDLGCGTGQLSLPLARKGAYVMAVDVSRAMVDRLEAKATASGVRGILGVVTPIEVLSLPEQSTDLVISNYALHHLRDRDKAAFVVEAASWLRPGGRLVVGDMMFGRGATARDRSIIASKVAVLARRGPAGWWRLAKNAIRFTLRLQERPVSMDTWTRHFEMAGLTDVSATPVVSEAAVIVGTKP